MKILLCCTAGYLAASLITYSQVHNPPTDDTPVNLSDGQPNTNAASGKNAQAAMRNAQETNTLSPTELQKLFVEKNEQVLPQITYSQAKWELTKSQKAVNGDPHWGQFQINWINVIPDLKINTVSEEKISLRGDFEKLGVKAAQQVGNSCTLYSAYHIAQYAWLSANKKPPSIQEVLTGTRLQGNSGVKVPAAYLQDGLNNFAKKSESRLTILNLDNLYSKPLFEEVVKHQLRMKRACRVSAKSNGNAHAIVVVGFHFKDGKTTWEYLNSNRIWENQGFATTDKISFSDSFSIWFE